MALHVQCDGCSTWQILDCVCPAEAGGHLVGCAVADPDGMISCPPDSDCCSEDHDHAAMANSCTGGHGDCPVPANCKHWKSVKAHHAQMRSALPPDEQDSYEMPGDNCPGGHCHVALEDCTVCRPLTITVLAGTVTMTHQNSALGG